MIVIEKAKRTGILAIVRGEVMLIMTYISHKHSHSQSISHFYSHFVISVNSFLK